MRKWKRKYDLAWIVIGCLALVCCAMIGLGYRMGRAPDSEWSSDPLSAPEDVWVVARFEAGGAMPGELDYRTLDVYRIGRLWFMLHGDDDHLLTPVNMGFRAWTHGPKE